MKTLKKILIVLVVLVAIPLIVALFVPKTFKTERSIVIDKPRQEVFDYLKYIKNQDHYGVWQLSDPGMKKNYEGTDGTVGFKYSWDSEKLGKGSQRITGIQEGERLDAELDFGFGEPAKSYFLTEAAGAEQTKVTWGISGQSPYPFNLMGLFYDMGKDFDQGLTNLKAQLEK
ncbi:SRPBCC family protein [Ravibacter arvi]|uniref:SRPBCC family protein n=1 Tax=Ravibacter arvi TaxID=2051041 RepID=A0ABP8M1B0_9BACT